MSIGGRARFLLGSLIVVGSGFVQVATWLPDRKSPATLLRDIAIVSLLAGIPLGFFLPRSWMAFCAAAAWGSIGFGVLVVRASGPGLAVPVMAVSLGAVFLGGALGALTRTRIPRASARVEAGGGRPS
jgi:hypothetical protein